MTVLKRNPLIMKRKMNMKLIGFNGSPRKDGNTTALMGYLLREIEKEGIQTELVQLSAKAIHGCIACHRCFENQDQRCAVKNDAANEYIAMMTSSGYCFGIAFLFSRCNDRVTVFPTHIASDWQLRYAPTASGKYRCCSLKI